MKDFILSPQAKRDVEEILDYISRDNPASAERVLSDLEQAIYRLADNPQMGHLREDLAPGKKLRFWRVHSYLVIYRPEPGPVQIVRVLSGYRDIEELLQ